MSSVAKCHENTLVIAIPVTGDRLSTHFGHCTTFALFEVDTKTSQIRESRQLQPPAHEPGVLPRWLDSQGVGLVIAGGMGQRAQDIFAEQHIDVLVGAPAESPQKVVQDYLGGELQLTENVCDH